MNQIKGDTLAGNSAHGGIVCGGSLRGMRRMRRDGIRTSIGNGGMGGTGGFGGGDGNGDGQGGLFV